MNMQNIVAASVMTLACVSCDRASEKPVLNVYHNGNEYEIIERGDIIVQGENTHFIRYYSDDPFDKEVQKAELADIYAIVAKHIDTNEHQRIEVTAVEREGRWFGMMERREQTQSISAEEVLKYKPKDKK